MLSWLALRIFFARRYLPLFLPVLTRVNSVGLSRSASSVIVRQALWAGRRIAFTEEVRALGPAQDITSLLEKMRQRANMVGSDSLTDYTLLLNPALNLRYGRNVGYFRNGLFFSYFHPHELALFNWA